jgi:precorrin-6Y C5,15-methyltransferase (decarboxylating)
MTPWLSIVGIGAEGIGGLPSPARVLIDSAEVLIGGARHLAMVPQDHKAERHGWATPLSDTVKSIRAMAGRRVTVLATGDPMSYGIGVTLAREFGTDAVTILPAPGAFSLAAARTGWPLHATDCITLHGRPLAMLNLFVRPGARLLILSENGDTPAQVARVLRERGYGASSISVFENMGAPDEGARHGIADGWNEAPTADLNTIAVECVAGNGALAYSRLAGLPDEAFTHDGQLTKRVVRAATLSALAPQPGEMLWDVGAGCGSVTIEWMRAGGQAVAIERSTERCTLIARNAAILGTPKLEIVTGAAPDALTNLPRPDAVFVGGGTSNAALLDACWDALARGGRLVANAVTLDGEAALLERHGRTGGSLTRIAVSEVAPIGRVRAWKPMRTVTQFSATKP